MARATLLLFSLVLLGAPSSAEPSDSPCFSKMNSASCTAEPGCAWETSCESLSAQRCSTITMRSQCASISACQWIDQGQFSFCMPAFTPCADAEMPAECVAANVSARGDCRLVSSCERAFNPPPPGGGGAGAGSDGPDCELVCDRAITSCIANPSCAAAYAQAGQAIQLNFTCILDIRGCAMRFSPTETTARALFTSLVDCMHNCTMSSGPGMPPPTVRPGACLRTGLQPWSNIGSSSPDVNVCANRCLFPRMTCFNNTICSTALVGLDEILPTQQCQGDSDRGPNFGNCVMMQRPTGGSADLLLAQRLYDGATSCYFACELDLRGGCEVNSTAGVSPCRDPSCFDAISGMASPMCCDALDTYCAAHGPRLGPTGSTVGDVGCTSQFGLAGMCHGSCSGNGMPTSRPGGGSSEFDCPECTTVLADCILDASCNRTLLPLMVLLQMNQLVCGTSFSTCMQTLGSGVTPKFLAAAQCLYGCSLKNRGQCTLFDSSPQSPCRTAACLDNTRTPSSACCSSVNQYCSGPIASRPITCSFSNLVPTCATGIPAAPVFRNCTSITLPALSTMQLRMVSVEVSGTADNSTAVSQLVELPAGESTVSVPFMATGPSGASSSCMLVIRLVDLNAPMITCPTPVTVTLGTGQSSATSECVLSGADTARAMLVNGSNCGGMGSITDDVAVARLMRMPPAGAPLPAGRNVVVYTAFDRRGNSASCNTTVTVIDVEPPTLMCPSSATLPEDATSVLTPMRVCISARDNDMIARINASSPADFVSINPMMLSAAFPSRSILNFSLVRRPSQPDPVSTNICLVLFGRPPSTQRVTITVADRSGNQASCAVDFTLTVSAKSSELLNLANALNGRVNASVLSSVASNLQNITSNVNALTPAQYSRSAIVLEQLVNTSRAAGPVNITQAAKVVQVFDQVLGISRANARLAQQTDGGVSSVRNALNVFVESFNGSTTPFSFAGPNLDLTIRPIVGAFTGFNFTAPGNETVKFQIPPLPGSGGTLAFTTYPDDRMFPSENSTATVLSRVIDVMIVGRNTSFLDPPARFTLEVSEAASDADLICVYYDVDSSSWSTRGVTTLASSGGTKQCSTTHFTNFAVLLAPGSSASTGTNGTALAVITIAGCVISLFCIFGTMLVHGASRLRPRPVSQALLGFSFALAFTFIFFIAASQMADSKPTVTNCRGVGMVLHFFILVTFASLSILASYVYSNAARTETSSSRVGLHLVIAWVASLIVLAICIGAADPSSYGGEAFCWINNRDLIIGGVLVPISVALAANVALVFLAYSAISANASGRKSSASSIGSGAAGEGSAARHEVNAVVLLSTLMGLVWFFGVLINVSNASASLFVQYCFAIFAILQGIVLFVMFVLLNPNAKQGAVGLDAKSGSVLPKMALTNSSSGVYVHGTGSSRTSAGDVELHTLSPISLPPVRSEERA